jgi:hypothetical protein
MKKKLAAVFLFLILLPVVLFLLRGWSLPGGDSAWISTLVTRPWHFFMRAPLVLAFHKTLWLVLRNCGWSPAECIALSSSLAGGVFLAGLWYLSRDWRVWLVVLVSKFSFVFLGHVEHYAWPYALSLWVFVLLQKESEGGVERKWIWALLALATFCHPMVLMVWPGVLWALYPFDRAKATEILVALLIFAGVWNVLMLVGKAGGLPQSVWVLPLFSVGETLARYPLFSWIHFRELLLFHLFTLPIGLVLLLVWGWKEWRGWRGGLILTAGIALLWSLVWHPGMGASDWDLFAWPALFVNLAGGLRWSEKAAGARARPASPAEPGVQ